jgi:hypothetical protein
MDSNPMATQDKNIHDLTDEFAELNNGGNQEVIVVDGRGYENHDDHKKEIYNLVDVVEDTPNADRIYEEIMKRATEIFEKIAREKFPEIAERVVREEIDKLKKIRSNDKNE